MKRLAWVSLVLTVGVLAIAATGFRAVRPGERVVVRRLGRLVQPAWGPGLHWGLPLGIDRFDRVRTDLVRRLVIGATAQDEGAIDPAAGEFLTGDLNLVRVQAIVQYRVSSPGEMLIASEAVDDLLGRLAEASLSRALARRQIDGVIRGDRQLIGQEVVHDLKGAVNTRRLGVQILGVSLTEARPPAEVAADFAAAQSAASQRDRRTNEAHTQAETTLTAGQARATKVLEAARAAAHRQLLSSQARSKKFLALQSEAQRSRTLTERRIYLDTMRSLLGKVRRKIVLPPGDTVDLTVLGIED